MDGLIAANSVTFGPWRYDRRPGGLFRQREDGRWEPASIGSRAGEILAILLDKPGTLVSKDDLMDAVWPGVTVEANNLTVQIAALRRVLDEGVAGPSCIQTVPGRGYRLLAQVSDSAAQLPLPTQQAVEIARPESDTWANPAPLPARRRWPAIGGAITLLIMASYLVWPVPAPAPPRMSAIVMPFENLGGPDDAKISAALTDDLKSSLSLTTPVQLVEEGDHRASVPAVSPRLAARFVVTGSSRQLDGILRINAQIVSTEKTSVLWTDRFDVSMSNPAAGQEQAVERLRKGIYTALTPLEAARSRSERPDNPDAFDLSLRAQALTLIPPTPSRSTEIRSLFERALQLKPSSAFYKGLLAGSMLDEEDQNPHGRKDVYERTASLLAQAQASDPGSWLVELNKLYWVYWQENWRCSEVVDLAEEFLRRRPNVRGGGGADRWLSQCQIVLGHADTAVTVMEHALSFEPEPYRSRDYRTLQFALLLLGRYDETIQAGQRALARNPDDVGYERARLNRRLAAAYALSGRPEVASRALFEADRLFPFVTLRSLHIPTNANPVYAAQFARYVEGLRLAGLRDHAEEDADFGAVVDHRLHQESSGPTPLAVPGAATIRTDDLVRLLELHPIVIDAVNCFAGRSIPGAIGLRYVGDGGTLADLAQGRLSTTMHDLTQGNLDKPIVAAGWNSESFDGRNLAMRLVALGYTHVSWYRGGREAWEVSLRSEAALTPQDW